MSIILAIVVAYVAIAILVAAFCGMNRTAVQRADRNLLPETRTK